MTSGCRLPRSSVSQSYVITAQAMAPSRILKRGSAEDKSYVLPPPVKVPGRLAFGKSADAPPQSGRAPVDFSFAAPAPARGLVSSNVRSAERWPFIPLQLVPRRPGAWD